MSVNMNPTPHNVILKGQNNWYEWLRVFRAESRAIGLFEWFLFPEKGGRSIPVRPIYISKLEKKEKIELGEHTELVDDREDFKFKSKIFQREFDEMNRANKFLIDRIDPAFYNIIEFLPDPASKINAIDKIAKPDPANALETLYARMENIKLHSKINVQEYINELMATSTDIKSITGGAYTDAQLKNKAIRGLPKTWSTFVESYRLTGDVNMSVPVFFHKMLTWESILESRGKDNYNGGDGKKKEKTKSGDDGSNGNNKKNDECPVCKKRHPGGEAECWFKHPDKNPWKNGTKKEGDKSSALADVETKDTKPSRKVAAHTIIDLAQFKKILQEAMNTDEHSSGMPTTTQIPVHSSDSPQVQPKTQGLYQGTLLEIESEVAGIKGTEVCIRGCVDKSQCLCHIENCRNEQTLSNDAINDKTFPQLKYNSISCSKTSMNQHSEVMLTSTSTSVAVERDVWLVDTGANGHIVNDEKWFTRFHKFDQNIGTADSTTSLKITGGGTASIKMHTTQNERVDLSLSEVALAPNARCNLLSVSALCEKAKLTATLSSSMIRFEDQNGEEIGYAIAENGLYRLIIDSEPEKDAHQENTVQPKIVSVVDFQNNPVWIWHRRLGHLGLESMRKLLKQSEGINLTDKQLGALVKLVCPVCAVTRAVVRIPRSPARRRYKELGELLHVDVWGPHPVAGYDGTTRLLLVTDDATRWTWIVRLKTKNEAAISLLKLHKKIERTENTKIRRYRFDNEFVQGAITSFAEEYGVEMEPSVPYTHHQNGTAERTNRTVRDKASAIMQEMTVCTQITNIIVERGNELLRSGSIPEVLWPEAMAHAVYIKNRAPTKSHKYKKTPFEAKFGMKPNFSKIKIWGSRTFVTRPHIVRQREGDNKIQSPRGWLGYFVGYDQETDSVCRIWSDKDETVHRISEANINDGEGLDDPHPTDAMNVRAPIPSLPDDPDEWDLSTDDLDDDESENEVNDETTSDEDNMNHEIQTNLAKRARPSDESEDEIDSDWMDAPEEDDDDADEPTVDDMGVPLRTEYARWRSIKNPKARKGLTFKHGRQRGNVPGRIPDSSKCDFCFINFRICDGNRPCLTCRKQGLECHDQTAYAKALIPKENRDLPDMAGKAFPMDDLIKCEFCYKRNSVCKADPLSQEGKCTNCEKLRRNCNFDYEESEVIKDVDKYRTEATCQPCINNHRRCNEEDPCDKCIARGIECYRPAKRTGVPFEEKCGTCVGRRRKCNGEMPCDTCIADNKNCKPQGWQEMPKCNSCAGKGLDCDRKWPCARCVKEKRACAMTDPDGLWVDIAITDEKKFTNLEEDAKVCKTCLVWRKKHSCDSQRPCTNCIKVNDRRKPGGTIRWCHYDLVDNKQIKFTPDIFTINENGKTIVKDDFAVQESTSGRRDKNKPIINPRIKKTMEPIDEDGEGMENPPQIATGKSDRVPSHVRPLPKGFSDDETEEPRKVATKPSHEIRKETKPKTKNFSLEDISEDEDEPLDDFEHLIGNDDVPTPRKAMMTVLDALKLPVPTDYWTAVKGPEGPLWKGAAEVEYRNLVSHDTWEVVPLPPGISLMDLKWIFRRKTGADGQVNRHKARIVVRGFQQKEGIDFTEIFASVVKPTTWRLLFVIGIHEGWVFAQFDVVTAFLNGDLEEDIYVKPPPGYPLPRGMVLKLKRALYGLKQASRQWYTKYRRAMEKLGWKVSAYDPCLFINENKGTFLILYVDDMIVWAPNHETIEAFKRDLFNIFDMTDEDECTYFLGMHIEHNGDQIHLHQRNAINQMLKRYGLEDIPTVKTPIREIPAKNEDRQTDSKFITEYISKVGSLIYSSQISRPDIAYAVSVAGRFNANPNQHHMDNVNRIFAYLKGTMECGITYDKTSDMRLEAFVDSDWGGCPDTHRSTTGWVVTFGGSPISWCSQRQKTVSLSSTEAEYVAASEAAKELIWLKGLVNELNLSNLRIKGIRLFIDNDSAVKLTKNAEFHNRTKHINIKHHFIRDLVEEGTIIPTRVDTTNNLADAFTKPLSTVLFEKHFKALKCTQQD